MKNIIWQNTDTGYLKVTHVLDDTIDSVSYAATLKLTDTEFSTDEAVLFDQALPKQRFWRDAWQAHNNSVIIEINKAKDVYKNALRAARQPALDALDIAFMRAVEQGDDALMADISRQKQQLRDLTRNPAINTALTHTALEALWPDTLEPECFA